MQKQNICLIVDYTNIYEGGVDEVRVRDSLQRQEVDSGVVV